VAIDLICTHVQRQLEYRSRRFRQKMAVSLSLKPSLSRGLPQEPSIDELGLTVLEQTPQLKVAFISVGVALCSYRVRVSTRSCVIEPQLDKISSSSPIAWQLYWLSGLWKNFLIEK
jgi:hypothetical protein